MDAIKVLIIDDDPLTCQLIGKMLKLKGYVPASLTDPALALETIATEQPGLVLIDYHLGSGHGLDILSELRSTGSAEGLPVIMTSGIDRRSEAIAAGAQEFLVKPFDWGTLAKTIDLVLKSTNNH